jgi:uncharacterized protein YbaR (Trm112 family)
VSRLAPLEPHALAYDKPLCASLDGFTLHAATRAGACHPAGREALLRCVLRPAVAQERVELRPDGLVRIAPASPWRRGLVPMVPSETPAAGPRPPRPEGAPSYRPWAQLLARTFAVDVLACPKCHGRMRLLEATEVPPRSPGRGPPYWKSRVLRRQALGEEDDGQGRGVQETE